MLNLRRLFGFGERAMTLTQTPEARALLSTVRRDVIPDPDVLLVQVRVVQQRHSERQLEWDHFDSGNPRAVLRQPLLAQQMLDDVRQEEQLVAAIADATRRREAFVELAERVLAIGEDVRTQLRAMLDHPPADDDERLSALRALDEDGRAWVRLVWALQRVSTHDQFREPPDALTFLRAELEQRVRDIDRLRVPGHKPRFAFPEDVQVLIDTMDGRPPAVKENTYAAIR